jgi:SAM-dependent methyltransferase
MTNHWDSRYSGDAFFYGIKPNLFFADFLVAQPQTGKLLLPAEGEGRNAVYAAQRGWEVTAFDSSRVAREKALKFAQEKSVSIDYHFLDIADFKAEENAFDLIALVFVHFHEVLRKSFHQELIRALKPGGVLVAALFAKEQIHQKSGGPPVVDLLYSKEILRQDFHQLNIERLDHVQTYLDEGRHHGRAEVLVFEGVKRING